MEFDATVILPCKDVAPFIDHQMAALLAQDYGQPWELIAVDNMSTDDTREILTNWAERFPNMRVIEANAGKGDGYARNAGARISRGSTLLFCDSDDVVTASWMRNLMVAVAQFDAVGGSNDVVELNTDEQRYWRGVSSPDLDLEHRFLPYAAGCNLAIRREVFARLGGFDESLTYAGTDCDLCWRVQLGGYSFGPAPDAVVLYRLRKTPRQVGRQAFRYGAAGPYLFKRFRSLGLERPSVLTSARSWLWTLVMAPRAARRRFRGRWLWSAGWNTGRLVGSIRARTLYF